MTKKVLSYKNLPARPPFLLTAVAWLYLDYYAASGWVWGAALTFLGVWWMCWLVWLSEEENVDLFAGGQPPHAGNGRGRAHERAVR